VPGGLENVAEAETQDLILLTTLGELTPRATPRLLAEPPDVSG